MDPAAAATAGCVLVAGPRKRRISAADVLDVVPWPRITPVPLQPPGGDPELLGVFEWKDAVVPVYDIAGLPAHERRRVVIVRVLLDGAAIPLGIAAAEVLAPDESATADLLAASDLAAKLRGRRR
jgi:chemotaxis signal transduction protein